MENLEAETRINRWWRLRLDQKIEECRLELAELKHGFEGGLESQGRFDGNLGAELKLMEAALWRAEGQVGRAHEQIESVGASFREAGISPSFQYYLQRGLHRLLASDYTGALELFLAARNTAPGSIERAWALANSLFCLEYLGLPFSRTREELAREMIGIELPEGISDQIEAFDLRAAFRGGSFGAFAAAPPTQGSRPSSRPSSSQGSSQGSNQGSKMTQAFYYRLWVSELPFLGAPKISEAARERFFSSDPWFHLRSYRVRTLQGMVHPDDLISFKPTELADRLYLWTWRWMAGPKEFRFDRLAPLLPSLEPKKLGYRLSAEDFQMIRNSLLWLALWDGCSAAELRDILSFLRPGQIGDYPIFDFERAVIGYFECVRDRRGGEAEQRLAYLRAHPLWNARFNEWRALVGAVAAGKASELQGPLAAFAAHLSEFLAGWLD